MPTRRAMLRIVTRSIPPAAKSALAAAMIWMRRSAGGSRRRGARLGRRRALGFGWVFDVRAAGDILLINTVQLPLTRPPDILNKHRSVLGSNLGRAHGGFTQITGGHGRPS